MLEWPRKAFMPPPATPMLPSSSWTMAIVRMFWRAARMLGPAEREQARHRLVRRRRGGDQLADLEIRLLRGAANARHHFRRVAVHVLAQQVDHAARMLPGVVDLGETLLVALVVPGRLVIAAAILVVAGEQAVLEAEALLHDQAGARVGTHIAVLDRIAHRQRLARTPATKAAMPVWRSRFSRSALRIDCRAARLASRSELTST